MDEQKKKEERLTERSNGLCEQSEVRDTVESALQALRNNWQEAHLLLLEKLPESGGEVSTEAVMAETVVTTETSPTPQVKKVSMIHKVEYTFKPKD